SRTITASGMCSACSGASVTSSPCSTCSTADRQPLFIFPCSIAPPHVTRACWSRSACLYLGANTQQYFTIREKQMQRQLRVRALMFAFSAFALTACGGGGSDSAAPDPAPPENALPTAAIVFPPADAMFTAETLTVRGTAADTD